jgi:hypothetical protein
MCGSNDLAILRRTPRQYRHFLTIWKPSPLESILRKGLVGVFFERIMMIRHLMLHQRSNFLDWPFRGVQNDLEANESTDNVNRVLAAICGGLRSKTVAGLESERNSSPTAQHPVEATLIASTDARK